MNLAEFDGPLRPEALVRLAASQRGRVFVGIEFNRRERQQLLRDVQDGFAEAAAFIAGRRQKRRWGRQR